MSVSAVAAAGTALAIYYVRRRGVCSEDPSPAETHSTVHSAPTTFMEDLFFLAEGLRYTYGETLGRWRTADLLIGLAYLCRKDPEEHPVSDIAQQGRPFGRGLAPELWPEALVQLGELERFFRYCSGLRERRPLPQRHYFRTVLDVTDEDLLMQELRAGVLKPSYLLVRDRKLQAVVLAIRGTHSFKDMFTSLTGASKPHHLVDANGVVLGYSHFGMLAAARWIKAQTRQQLEQALADNPGYRLKIIGHSLGGGTAALLTMMLREEGGIFAQSTCVAIACPSCMTLELAQSCSDYVTTVVHNADVIPTICPGSADTLRAEVMRSSWFGEFRRDVRSSGVVRAVENGLRGVGSATLTATSWTTSKLAACYQRGSFGGGARRRQLLKRRNSDDSLAATAAAEEAAAAAASAAVPSGGGGEAAALLGGSPLSASAPAGSGFGAFAAALEEEQQQEAAAGGHSATADGTAERLGSGGGWGLRVSQQLSGRGAAVLSGTSQVLQSTSGVLRSTSGLLMRRMWPVGGGEAAGAGNGGALAAAAAAEAAAGAAAADAAPDQMEIEAADEEELAAYADGFPLDGGDGDEDMGGEEGWEEDEAAAEQPGGGAAGSSERISISYQERRQMRVQLQLERSGSLEEEVSLRMHEVRQAVHDAEEEEQASGRDDSTVPAVIRPGGYGIGGGPSAAPLSPSKLDPKWKRQMYPAGRILHLVPARLVPGTAAYAAAAAAAAAAAQAAKAASAADASASAFEAGDLGLAAVGGAAEAAAASAGDAEAAAAGPAAAAAGGSAAAVPGGTAASGTATGPTVRPRHAAKLSVSDLIGGEEMLGRRSCAGWEDAPAGDLGGNGGDGDEAEQAQQAQQQAQQQAVQEEMLLLDFVPQEAYARIRLCRTVLSDHIIPNYLKSLESALQHIKEHAELVPVPVPAPAPAPTGTAAADKGATSAPASLAAAAAAAAPSVAAAPAAGEAVGARGGSHAAAAGPMSPSAGSSSPAAAAAAAALRSAAAKASFSKSSKHD